MRGSWSWESTTCHGCDKGGCRLYPDAHLGLQLGAALCGVSNNVPAQQGEEDSWPL